LEAGNGKQKAGMNYVKDGPIVDAETGGRLAADCTGDEDV